MRRALISAGVAAALIGAGAGCGGDAGPGPGDAVRGYYRALAAGNGADACGRLTGRLRQDLAASAAARSVGGTCPDVLGLASGLNPDLRAADIDDLRVDVEEDGDRAAARLRNPLTGKPEVLRLERRDGRWSIDSLVLRPRR